MKYVVEITVETETKCTKKLVREAITKILEGHTSGWMTKARVRKVDLD